MLNTHLEAWPELLTHCVYSLPAWKLTLLSANPVTSSDSLSHGGEPLAGLCLAGTLLFLMSQPGSSCRAESCTNDYGWMDVLLLLLLAAYRLVSVLLEQLVQFNDNSQTSATSVWLAACLYCFMWGNL